MEVVGYLTNVMGPVSLVTSLVLDLRITYDRFGCSSDPIINGHLHYPTDIDRSLNETVSDKIRKYGSDDNNKPPKSVSFMTVITSTSDRLHSETLPLPSHDVLLTS
jgi:hypothetical protein